MNRSIFRSSVVIGALVAIAASIMAPTAAHAAGAFYYPSGPQVNVPVSTVTSGGWVLCWSESYRSTANSSIQQVLAGTATGSVSPCDGANLLLTGWLDRNPAVLPVLAAAPAADVIDATPKNNPRLSNGSYWYHNPNVNVRGGSIGFSPNNNVIQNTCDVAGMVRPDLDAFGDGTQSQRLCWHLSRLDTIYQGWSLGSETYLQTPGTNGSGAAATRAIFKSLPLIDRGAILHADALSNALKVALPAGGSFGISVSDASSGVCAVRNDKLFGLASGYCSVTLTSYKANGTARTAATKLFFVY